MRFNPNGEDVRPNVDDYEHQYLRKSYKRSTYAWQPDNENDEILRVTKSSVGSFDFCPKSWLPSGSRSVLNEGSSY